jgi:hypothetical protein
LYVANALLWSMLMLMHVMKLIAPFGGGGGGGVSTGYHMFGRKSLATVESESPSMQSAD